MSTQTDRLEALLQRVQDNRQKPHALGMAHTVAVEPNRAPAARAPVAPAPAAPAAAVPDARVRASAPEARPKQHAATPLEIAVEGRISQPVRAEPAQRPPVSAPPPQGVVLADAAAMPPSKPIAHVVSPHPPAVALTFGELLRRSLALRPH